ncbi:N-acetyllactosaminide beta-1,3-N-acetylglucosaminyltransferase 2 [Esox lucius]|uniref:Hexosyltransferase n=1 Tax=Esox lucius TaxID=8010 RepID=A0A3P8YE77_ESOLU|nr:N-acetyllactosaminide beta-1,3-N-acetylglucosaminyltransferase 2 [Esox lucius]XP_010865969.1 N-acetyllactosaminide beta-1,3-N-acetylglucosaminyltransferase 2 [Esox lucius]XP_019902445.1 N-acetyllactosaminide beta-1,3-N-acetylglucosaminyltransferase 2 [Esox lucius]
MAGLRRKLKVLLMFMMVNLFIFIVSRSGGPDKSEESKVLVPSKRFWSKLTPSQAFWNLQQQRLDFQGNPVLAYAYNNDSGNVDAIGPIPDWLNGTGPNSDPCQPDYSVTSHVADYNSLPVRLKDFLLYMRCRSYPLVVDQPDICRRTPGGESPYLLIAVKSLASHFDRRQAIRESWGRAGVLANKTVVTVFLLGNSTAVDHHPDLSEMLRYENARHRDILQWNYRDTFFNLTIKEVLFLDWMSTRCPGAQYIFKGDDDVFVNTLGVLDFLKGLSGSRAKDLFIGDVITNAGPHRDKKVKYFIPESLFLGVYPPYAGGGGYLFSGNLTGRLLWASRHVALYPIDDVYTGMCLRKLGLAPEKHKGFRTFGIEEKYRRNPCAYRSLLLVHSRTPQEMIQIWAWLNDTKLNCQ